MAWSNVDGFPAAAVPVPASKKAVKETMIFLRSISK